MKSVSREGVTVDVCSSCGAMWFDAGELQRVVAEKRERFARWAGARSPFDPDEPESTQRGFRPLDLLDLIALKLEIFFSDPSKFGRD